MLPLESGSKLAVAQWISDHVYLRDLAVGRKFVLCIIIVAIFIGLGEIMKLSYGGKSQSDSIIFMEEVDPSRHHVGNWKRSRVDEMVKNGEGKSLYFM